MARYVSKYRRFSISPRPQREILTVDGYPMVAQTQIVCDFQHGGVTEWEKKAALDVFKIKGIADGSEAWERLSVYDTAWADPIEQEEIEAFLDRAQGEDFIRVDKPALAPPWPNYAKLTDVKEILRRVRDDGYNPDDVAVYERENLNRSDLLSSLGDLNVPEADEEEVLA